MIITSRIEELEAVGEVSKVCSQIVLKCLYLARTGRPDILWSVNKLARSITKWTKACDRRLARLTSYIHHTSDCRQCCHVRHTAQHCRLGLIQDSDFAGDLDDSKSTSGWFLCVFGSRTCARRKRQYPTVLQDQKSFRWMLFFRMDGFNCSRFMGCGDRSVTFIEQYQNTNQSSSRTLFAESQIQTPNKRDTEMLISCRMWTTSPQTQILLKVSLSCTSLKTTKQRSKWSSRGVQRRDTCQEPTELR